MTKPIARWLLLLLAFSLQPASFNLEAAQVHPIYYFGDYTGRPLNVRRVTVTPLGPSAEYNGTNLSRSPIVYTAAAYPTLTNGTITISNLVAGYAYRVAFADGYSEPAITNYFGTNLTGVVSAYTNETTHIEWRNGVAVQFYGPYFGSTNIAYYINTNSSGSAVTGAELAVPTTNAGVVTITVASNHIVGIAQQQMSVGSNTISAVTGNILALTGITASFTALSGLGTGITELPYAGLTAAARLNITNAALKAAQDATNSIQAGALTGTLPNGVFPATLPAASGANLTALPAASLTGTIDDARLPNTITSDITGNAATATTATTATNLVWDQRFNVKNYGARGDSVTDDTASFLNAFAAAKAAGGGDIYLPGLTNNNFYAVTLIGNAGAINVTNAHNITVIGDGDSSFVKCVDAVNNNVAVFKIWLSTNFNMRNIRVSGGADVRAFSSLENEGVNLIFCTNGVMENVTVERVLADAWDLDWCYGFSFHNIVSRNIGGSGWKPNGYNFTLFGGRMDNCGKTATEADRGGLVIPDAYGVSVFGTIITNCQPSIYLSGSQRVLVEGVHCWMTNNTFTNVFVFGGTDQNISKSTFTGGYGVWTTNNIGGSSGPTGLTLSENKFWTTTMLHVQTDVTDLQVFGNKHNFGLNPLGSVSAHSIFLVRSIRASIQKNNIRVNGSAIYFTGTNHELQVADNYFGTYTSQAVYAPNNSAVATNVYFANNIFNQAGVNSISFSDSLSVSNGVFTGNLMKGMFRLQGGSHFVSNNKLESGMLIYNTACISNVIMGNFFGNTNWYVSQVPQNSYWLNNTGDNSATTNNADYIALRFTRGWLNSSNTVASWLTAPRYAGDVYFPPASNGVQYVLYSTNGAGAATTSWTMTNYFGPN